MPEPSVSSLEEAHHRPDRVRYSTITPDLRIQAKRRSLDPCPDIRDGVEYHLTNMPVYVVRFATGFEPYTVAVYGVDAVGAYYKDITAKHEAQRWIRKFRPDWATAEHWKHLNETAMVTSHDYFDVSNTTQPQPA